MHVTLVGLPLSGKTTVFNALTGQQETVGGGFGRPEIHLATVKVPDVRLEGLALTFEPQRVTSAEVRFVDLGGISEGSARQGLPPQTLAAIGEADALVHIVRLFENPLAPHPIGSIDPLRDLELLESEFLLTDMGVIERRLERLAEEIGKLRRSDREEQERERDLLQRLQEQLEDGQPLRDLELLPTEEKALRGYNLLTLRPVLVLLNLGEGRLEEAEEQVEALRAGYQHRHTAVAAICAQLEMELAELDPEDAIIFRRDLGLEEPAVDRFIRQAYDLLGLMTFFTFVSDEVRAWPLPHGSTAVEAAGTVHSDMAAGFIRAEVVGYEALVEAGSIAEARQRGQVTMVGRDYVVRDGDVCTFHFAPPRGR